MTEGKCVNCGQVTELIDNYPETSPGVYIECTLCHWIQRYPPPKNQGETVKCPSCGGLTFGVNWAYARFAGGTLTLTCQSCDLAWVYYDDES